MSDPVTKVVDKVIDELFNEKRYTSVTCYLLSGILGMVCLVSKVSPFICSSIFLDNIAWKGDLSNSDLVVRLPVTMILVYLISYLFSRIILRSVEVNEKRRKSFVHLFTIVDMFDLFTSLGTLMFMISVFLQMYKTGDMLMSKTAMLIYFWVATNFFALIYVRYANVNARIIDNSLKRYPDINQ